MFATMLIALAAAQSAPAPAAEASMSLAEFIDAAAGQCWAVDKDGLPVPRAELDELRGSIEIECIVAGERENELI